MSMLAAKKKQSKCHSLAMLATAVLARPAKATSTAVVKRRSSVLVRAKLTATSTTTSTTTAAALPVK